MDKEFLEGLGSLDENTVAAILEKAQQENKAWQDRLDEAEQAHTRQREQMILEHGISLRGGKNVKAISALLDTGEIFSQEDAAAALSAALDKLQADCDYLFAGSPIPPFSHRAGAGDRELQQPATLASVLKARMKK